MRVLNAHQLAAVRSTAGFFLHDPSALSLSSALNTFQSITPQTYTHPMCSVIGFHVIGCTYGFWLPNDQRGSGSDFVRSDALTKFGPAHPVTGRSVARKPFDVQIRRIAKESLKYPPVVLTNAQIA